MARELKDVGGYKRKKWPVGDLDLRLESNAEETSHFPSISDGVGLSSS